MFKNIKRQLQVRTRNLLKQYQTRGSENVDETLIKSASSIFRHVLKDPETLFFQDRFTDKRMLKLERLKTYIIVTNYLIEITTDKNSYRVELGPAVMTKLITMYDNKLALKYKEEEDCYRDQLSLGLILLQENFTN